jgi:FkbM family methyltransferase
MGVRRRLDLINAFFSPSRDFPFSAIELIKGLVRAPCTHLAPRCIESIRDDGDYLVVQLRSCKRPLYWPKDLPLFNLYMVITEGFYKDDWHFYEVPETRVSPGDVVLDCGAAEGLFSLRVMERAKHIVAFEPLPQFVTSMGLTFAGVENVTVVPYALGSAEGSAFLSVGAIDSHVSKNQQGIPIQITTVDHWVEQSGMRVDLVKGDLESFELEVLRGGAQTIKRYAPKIAMTVYHQGNDWKEILSFCRSLVPDYQYRVKGISFLDRKRVRPVMIHLWPQ